MDVLTRDPATPESDPRWLPAAEVVAAPDTSALEQRVNALEEEQAQDDAEQAAAKQEVADLYAQLQAVALRPDDDDDEEARAQVATLVGRIATLEGRVVNSPSAPAPATNDIELYNVLPAGASDNDRLTEALRLQALDPARTIRLTYRDHGRVFTRTNVYNGKPPRIVGPCMGLTNPEQGIKPPVLITVNVGEGDKSWFVGQGQTFNLLFWGIAIKSDNGVSQFLHHSYNAGAGTIYAGTFGDLTFYGFKYVWGKPGDALTTTLCRWAGAIQYPGIKSSAICLRGADSWYEAQTNLDGVLGGGQYHVRLESWTKSHLRNCYITARGATRALYNESSDTGGQGGTYVEDCVIEGHNADDPCGGALVVNKSGHLFLDNTPVNFGMAAPMDATIDTALVRVLGGMVSVQGVSTSKASSVTAKDGANAAKVPPVPGSPFAHVSAGILVVGAVFPGLGGSLPVVRRTGSGKVNPPLFTLAEG
jgi:hypothetical protein